MFAYQQNPNMYNRQRPMGASYGGSHPSAPYGGGFTGGFGNSFGSGFQMPTNFQFVGHLEPKARQYLAQVYQTLALALAAATVGVVAYMRLHFSLTLSAIAMFGLTMWLFSTPHIPNNPQQLAKRRNILMAIAFANGAMIAPLVEVNLYMDSGIVFTALACTAALFGSFTLAAMYAERRHYFFLAGALGTASSMLFVISLASMFSRSTALFGAQLYLGLLVFAAYVVFDTQIIIEKAHMGHSDYIADALKLFTDFIRIFVHILAILMRNKDNRRRKDQRR